MANLLYVTNDILDELKKHPAYVFWRPIIQNQPLRSVALEERVFHPRKVTPTDGNIYLTLDMNFVYCRAKQFSYMYVDQDLSFRLTAKDGILRTVDSKQFSAIIGRVGKVVDSTAIELVDLDKVYHDYFDSRGNGHVPVPAPASAPAKQAPAPPPAASKAEPSSAKDLVLGRFPRSVCDEMVRFRTSSKKSYRYLAGRFGLSDADVKEICNYYLHRQRTEDLASKAPEAELAKVDNAVRDHIIRLKKVSKKSYSFLAERFELPESVIRSICASHLKRPRRR
jgi:hypothetical protein